MTTTDAITTGAKAILSMDDVKIDPALALRVPAALAVRRQVLPFALVDEQVCVACVDQVDSSVLQALNRHLQKPVKLYPAEPDSLRRALDRIHGSSDRSSRGRSDGEGDSAVTTCQELLSAALLREASDLHIDPEQDRLRVRLRVDGVLEDYRPLPMSAHAGVISRFKVLASMDIAEKRAPQDGRFRHPTGVGDRRIDIRVASLPTRYGERMTLRLLGLQDESLTLERLGMNEGDLATFTHAVDRPHGLILLTGPTGSGKTTTLYAAIRRLIAESSLNVLTVEDPIEYELPGVAQVSVDSADKINFSKALRSMLRHDPDVVMIGEIRDHETADVAIKAALTGHLVLSTMHTNSAASAVTRIIDMGIDRFLVAATLRLAAAQRLVRRLCRHCRKPRPLTSAEAEALGRSAAAGQTVFDALGCMYCANRGYVGRLGVFEMMGVDQALSRSIAGGAEEAELTDLLLKKGAPQLCDDGLQKLVAGATSPAELLASVVSW
jgi:type IV pilus assembly protein PilB